MSDEKKLSQQELLWKIYESTEKTRKYIMWGRIFSFIKILIIVVPIVLAIIYLPPYIEKITAPFNEFMGEMEQGKGSLKNINLEELFKQYK